MIKSIIITPTQEPWYYNAENEPLIISYIDFGENENGYFIDSLDYDIPYKIAQEANGGVEWFYDEETLETYNIIKFTFPYTEEIITIYNVGEEYIFDPGGGEDEEYIWDTKPLTGYELPHTISNWVLDGNTAFITIKNSDDFSGDIKWWRYPATDKAEDIIYRTPTNVIYPNSKTALIELTPCPLGKFFIENGDLTKEYEIIGTDEFNTVIQFSNSKIQVMALESKYSMVENRSLLRLFKIVNGVKESSPTALFIGTPNSMEWTNPAGTTGPYGAANTVYRLYGVYNGKTFDDSNYHFAFSNLAFRKPYDLKKGWSDILYYSPSGSTDGFTTGDFFYEDYSS